MLFLFSGCEKEEDNDACNLVDCQNGAYCYEGNCYCAEFTYGTNCENQMTGFIIDSIKVQHNTLYDPSGNLIEGPGEGNPDLSVELLYRFSGGLYTTLHSTTVNNEVPVSTQTTFSANWSFSLGAFMTDYRLILKDYDAGSSTPYHEIRQIDFTFKNKRGEASQAIDTPDGQFVATMYYSYQ